MQHAGDTLTSTDAGPWPMGSLGSPAAPTERLPQRIASYRIIELLGRGGMGVVYRAEQQQPRRMVALKILPLGLLPNERLIRRFEHEAEVLGRMQHEGIAQIYEAGTADTGDGPQPFFAMELVNGTSLTDYARQNSLDVRERLALMARVCDAVQYAHQQGVIHRDLKPANILVQPSGNPKVLDFGVARATQGETPLTVETAAGQVIGTLPYMSPEQASGDVRALDNRADVYALGVILYELLAGCLPHDLSGLTLVDAARTICDSDPPRLSTLARECRGDVEVIVCKALEKEKDRRYGSAAELAEDLRRFLNNEPIRARAPSRWYQFAKFTKRHKVVVSSVAMIIVALTAGFGVATWQAVEATRQKRAAEQAFDFLLLDVLGTGGDAREAKIVLDRASAGLKNRLTDQPRIRAAITRWLGEGYLKVGRHDLALPHLEEALATRRREYGDDSRETIWAMNSYASALRASGQIEQALRQAREAAERARRCLGAHDVDTVRAVTELAWATRAAGDGAQAERLAREAYDACRQARGDDDGTTVAAFNAWGCMLEAVDRLDDAASVFAQVLEKKRRLPPGQRDLIQAAHNLARVCVGLRRLKEAESLYQEALDHSRRAAPGAAQTFDVMLDLASLLLETPVRAPAAAELFREAWQGYASLPGTDELKQLRAMQGLAHALAKRDGGAGDLEEAARLLRLVLERLDSGKHATAEGQELRRQVMGALAKLTELGAATPAMSSETQPR